MPTIEHNGSSIIVPDMVAKKIQPILTKISTDREFASLMKRDFKKAISTYRLSREDLTALKKLL